MAKTKLAFVTAPVAIGAGNTTATPHFAGDRFFHVVVATVVACVAASPGAEAEVRALGVIGLQDRAHVDEELEQHALLKTHGDEIRTAALTELS
jgi:hypothetical protein